MRWDGVVLLDSVVCPSVCAVLCPSVCVKDRRRLSVSSAVGWSSAVRQRGLSVCRFVRRIVVVRWDGVVLLVNVVCLSVCAKDCSSAVGWSSAVRQRGLSVCLCEGL